MSKLKCNIFFIMTVTLSLPIFAQDDIEKLKNLNGHLISCWSEGQLVINDTLDSVEAPSILSSAEGINIKGASDNHHSYYFSINENTICRLRIKKDSQEVMDEILN